MKKLTKTLLLVVAMALAAVMAVCVAACGGESREEWETYAGIYKFSKLEATSSGPEGIQSSEIVAGENIGGVLYSAETYVIELKSNGRADIKSNIANMSNENNLNWYVEGDKLLFKEMKSNSINYFISNGKIESVLTMEVAGTKMTNKLTLNKV